MTKIMIDLPQSLHRELKIKAAKEGTTLAQVVKDKLGIEKSPEPIVKQVPEIEGVKKGSDYTKEQLDQMTNIEKRALGI